MYLYACVCEFIHILLGVVRKENTDAFRKHGAFRWWWVFKHQRRTDILMKGAKLFQALVFSRIPTRAKI